MVSSDHKNKLVILNSTMALSFPESLKLVKEGYFSHSMKLLNVSYSDLTL